MEEDIKNNWINFNDYQFNKNFNRYMEIKFKEQLIFGESKLSVEEFKYWNDEWNKE
jgi:hypothetical protein